MVALACVLPHSFEHPFGEEGKIGPVFRPRRHPLIVRFFPSKRVNTLFAERNLHLVVSSECGDEIQPLDFLIFNSTPPDWLAFNGGIYITNLENGEWKIGN